MKLARTRWPLVNGRNFTTMNRLHPVPLLVVFVVFRGKMNEFQRSAIALAFWFPGLLIKLTLSLRSLRSLRLKFPRPKPNA